MSSSFFIGRFGKGDDLTLSIPKLAPHFETLTKTPRLQDPKRKHIRLALRSSDFGEVGTSFVDIVTFIPLRTPEYGVHQGGAERATTEVFQLTSACAERMLSQTMLDGSKVADRVNDVTRSLLEQGFQVSGVTLAESGDATLAPQSAIQIPVGLCFLIQNSLWRTLAVVPTGKWDMDCDVLGLLKEVKAVALQCESRGQSLETFLPLEGLRPTNTFFSMLADDLCEWSRAILNASEDSEATAAGLERYVLWLNTMREATCKQRTLTHVWEPVFSKAGKRLMGGDFSKLAGSHGRYRALFLIQCVLLALEVKCSSSLGVALQRAFAVLPEIWSKTLSECFAVQCVPSGATISRSRLYLDAAFMLYMREQHEEQISRGSVFFCLMDSSPQGFQNWMMSEAPKSQTVSHFKIRTII